MNLKFFRISKIPDYLNLIVNQKKPLLFIFGFILILFRLSKFIKIKRNGYILIFYPSAISLTYFSEPNNLRTTDENLLESLLLEGDIYIDIGANIGALALNGAYLVKSTGSVYAIEAHPKTFNYLKGNVNFNKFENIKLFQCAVGEKFDKIYFSDRNDDDQNSVSIKPIGIKVDIFPLDKLIQEEKSIKLLKIDIEGYELFALKGAIKTLNKCENLFIEINEEAFNKYGYSISDLIEFINKCGFDSYRFDKNFQQIKIDKYYLSSKIENIICKRR